MQKVMKYMLAVCILATAGFTAAAQTAAYKWNELPVRGLLMSAPAKQDVAVFCEFVRKALPKEGVNTLAIRIEYGYQYKSHPEVAEKNALSESDVKQIVKASREAKIRLIPVMNLMAHQSEATEMGPLLKAYPQFDESPDYNPPVPWKSGGMFDFYSKSVCPRHPDLLKVFFPMMDELVEAFEADALHVGLDEVWIIGYEKCPRCGGGDKSEIFAEYVNKLHNHLQEKGVEMWMWSDRLIDGKTTNLLAWQASMNDTHRAIDRISKDIVITDWKYESAPPTPGYFALKGFNVLASPCSNTEVALDQLKQVLQIRKDATRAEWALPLGQRMQGVFETMWFNSKEFIDAYYERGQYRDLAKQNVIAFKALFKAIREAQKQ